MKPLTFFVRPDAILPQTSSYVDSLSIAKCLATRTLLTSPSAKNQSISIPATLKPIRSVSPLPDHGGLVFSVAVGEITSRLPVDKLILGIASDDYLTALDVLLFKKIHAFNRSGASEDTGDLSSTAASDSTINPPSTPTKTSKKSAAAAAEEVAVAPHEPVDITVTPAALRDIFLDLMKDESFKDKDICLALASSLFGKGDDVPVFRPPFARLVTVMVSQEGLGISIDLEYFFNERDALAAALPIKLSKKLLSDFTGGIA